MSVFKDVWVMAEKAEALTELCAGGHQLGERVTALVVGTKEHVEKAVKSGADQVYWLGETSQTRIFEDYTQTIFTLLAKEKPEVLLLGASKRVKLIAGRLAACLKTSVLTDVMELTAEGSSLQAKRLVFGGTAIRTEKSAYETMLALVGAGVFEVQPKDADRKGSVLTVPFVEGNTYVKWLEKQVKVGESVNLAAAKRVVGIGRGLKNKEDLSLIKDLAEAIGAEVGCSRPLAEGVDWLPRERYIGVSGAMLKPDIYFAIGISGQIQHMVGANQARTVVAINADKNAPIFAQSDYGVIGDLYKVLPSLIERIKKTGKYE